MQLTDHEIQLFDDSDCINHFFLVVSHTTQFALPLVLPFVLSFSFEEIDDEAENVMSLECHELDVAVFGLLVAVLGSDLDGNISHKYIQLE